MKDGRGVYTSTDIANAIESGYTITAIHRGLVWKQSCCPFKTYIDMIYPLKQDEDHKPEAERNHVKRQVGKLLLNALYGKMLQAPVNSVHCLARNIQQVYRFFEQNRITDYHLYDDQLLLIGEPINLAKRITKPAQLGAFILGHSRKLMLDLVRQLDPTLTQPVFTYTDTDCLHLPSSLAQKLEGQRNPLSNKLWSEPGLGGLTNEYKTGKIVQEVCLAPKQYATVYLTDDGQLHTTLKCKAIPQLLLQLEMYLQQESEPVEMTDRLKKVGASVSRSQQRAGFQPFDIQHVDTMRRTFSTDVWGGMKFDGQRWTPYT